MKIEGKIIGVGFQKTGTSSLRKALMMLGYRVKDNSTRPLIPILRGNFNKVLHMIQDYDAMVDTPWYMIYKELDEKIPGSKFILTLRDDESWFKSVSRHIGVLRNPNHEYVYGRGRGLPMEDKENTLKVYNKHIREVKEYFKDRPDDFLVLDLTKGDGWEQLCPFLGHAIPNLPFPHANRWKDGKGKQSYYGERKDFKYYRKYLRHWIKIKYIDLKKLW